MKDSTHEGYRATTISIVLNTALAVIKLISGIFGHSYALIADAIESFSDIFSSTIVRVGLVIASKPPDDNHPYGHGKAEPLAALFVSILFIGGAALIAFQAIGEIQTPHHTPKPFTLVVLLVVVAVKELAYRYEIRVGNMMDSTAVKVDAWHHRSDALTSAAAAIGIMIALVGGKGYEPADDWAALVVCVVIVMNGTKFARIAIHELMDTIPATTLVESIRLFAGKINEVRLIETLVVRKVGPHYYVDLHVEVDPDLTVIHGHDIAHNVKDAIISEFENVTDVLVHIEPHVHLTDDHDGA